MKYTKPSRKDDGTIELVPVSFHVILGDALIELLRSGVDEATHLNVGCDKIDDDDLEAALDPRSSSIQVEQMMSYIRPAVYDVLREILDDRREEAKRFGRSK